MAACFILHTIHIITVLLYSNTVLLRLLTDHRKAQFLELNMLYGQTSSTLWGPKPLTMVEYSSDFLECSVHTLPKPLLREFSHVFDERHTEFQSDAMLESDAALELLAIPINQRAREDLVGIGEKIEMEKDRLLNVFMSFANMRDI
jgi:hypothetical protein